MSKFFTKLHERGLLADYAKAIDWLFDEEKMSAHAGWSRAYKVEFTKQMQTLPYLSKNAFHYNDGTSFPNPVHHASRPRNPIVIMRSHNGKGHDFIAHLRNSIAHGNAEVYGVANKGLYIEAKDYSDDSKKKQTAYIAIPLNTLNELMRLYKKQEKKIQRKAHKG